MRAGSLAFFQFVRDNEGLWSATYGAGRSTPGSGGEVAGELSEIRSRQNELVQTLIEAVSAPLELEPGKAAAFARGLNGMYEGLAGWALEHPAIPTERLAQWMREIILPGFAALVERES